MSEFDLNQPALDTGGSNSNERLRRVVWRESELSLAPWCCALCDGRISSPRSRNNFDHDGSRPVYNRWM